jgi:DNA-binding transcriptional ArsR family regulator
MRERHTIRDAAAAALLNRPRLHGVLAALIERDCAMAELAELSGMSYSLLSHHLRHMVRLGLVRIAGKVPRAGRASTLYRAVARSYFVPAVWCQSLPGDQLADELHAALQRASSLKGLLLWSEGGPRIRLIHDQPRPDALEIWARLRLTPAMAGQFNEELSALVARWREQESAKGVRYLIHAACAKSDNV